MCLKPNKIEYSNSISSSIIDRPLFFQKQLTQTNYNAKRPKVTVGKFSKDRFTILNSPDHHRGVLKNSFSVNVCKLPRKC